MSQNVYSPSLRDSRETMVVRIFESPRPLLFNEGGLARAAELVRQGGRGEDEVLLHITPEEFEVIKSQWGEPDINPNTGLPEYGFLSKVWKKVKKAFKKIAPFAGILASIFAPGLAPALGGLLGASGSAAGAIGNAIIGAGSGAITGGGKGALAGALSGGLGGMSGSVGSKALSTLGMGELAKKGALSQIVGRGLVHGAANKVGGGSFTEGLKSGALAGAVMPIAQNALSRTALGDRLGIEASQDPTLLDEFGLENNPFSQASNTVNEVDVLAQRLPIPGEPQGTATGSNVPVPGTPPGTPAPVEDPGLMGMAKKYAVPALLAYGALGSQEYEEPVPPELSDEFLTELPELEFNRSMTPTAPVSWYTYGQGPEHSFYEENALPEIPEEEEQEVARGGALTRLVRGPGTGRSDDIPARLSDGEYVIDAETVALLGDGSTDEGARRLDQLREKIRKHKGRNLSKGKFSHKAKDPASYLGGL